MVNFWKSGEHWVFLTAFTLALVLLLIACFLWILLQNGLVAFWPRELVWITQTDGRRFLGEIVKQEEGKILLKVGNRDLYGYSFRWISKHQIQEARYPLEAILLEREEYGNFYGFVKGFRSPLSKGEKSWQKAWEKVKAEKSKLKQLERRIQDISYRIHKLEERMRRKKYYQRGEGKLEQVEREELSQKFKQLVQLLEQKRAELLENFLILEDASGRVKEIPFLKILRAYYPNQMSFLEKAQLYLAKWWELLSKEPRESNTEGGLFPAIVGTVLLVFLMSIFSFPLGVCAGIYLQEYARDTWFVKLVRIGVNNLAGIPSIVYGVFGLGFFVYGLGSWIDQVFFAWRLPTPTFGTGGLLWASVTLGLLTIPVVIVATEEALRTVPKDLREASYALGATQWQTLTRIVLPAASPGILTGFILAMARAAGEVAPLMLTGVVKLAPHLPLDGEFPYLHLERKFMHLGFHIYDVGFQSPDVEAAKPMVYVSALLLLVIILCMTGFALYLRKKLTEKYKTSSF